MSRGDMAADLPPVAEWRLHIGAHKTATTHVQMTLAAQRAALAAQGVDFLPLELVRPLHFPPSGGRFDWRRRIGGAVMRRHLEDWVRPARGGPPRLAITEENILGNTIELLRWPFYPRAVERLRRLRALTETKPVRLFLSIRSPDALLPSAYAQTLRTRHVPGGFEAIRERALRDPPSWRDLVARIEAALPRATLRIWTLEDYRENRERILSAYAGAAVDASTAIAPPLRTRSPSRAAIAALEALDPGLSVDEHTARAAEIVARDEDGERFDPFSPEERTRLRDAYRADVEALAPYRI